MKFIELSVLNALYPGRNQQTKENGAIKNIHTIAIKNDSMSVLISIFASCPAKLRHNTEK